MILNKQDCEQFFAIYDALTDFANGKWGVAPAVIDPRSGFVNEANQRKVAAEVWRNTKIIEEFVQDNPYALSSEELQIARDWKYAFTDTFYAIQPAPRTMYFMNADAAFLVTGLSREVVSMLGSIPSSVTATLLPFKDNVVFAVYLEEVPVLMGKGLVTAVEKAWSDVQANGIMVKTGQQLVDAVPELEEKRISREAERMLSSLEADMSPDDPGEGAHRGVLADVSPEERERLVHEHAYAYPDGDAAKRELVRYCQPGEPERSLSKLLMSFTREELLGVTRDMHIKGVSGKNKAGLAEAITQHVLEPEALENVLATMDPEDFEHVKELYDQGGYMSIPADQIKVPERFCPYIPLVSYPYLVDGEFVFTMPLETYEACKALNWDTVCASQQELKLAVSVANMLVELRGAVPLSDVYDQYCALSANPFELGEVAMAITYGPRSDLALYDLWFSNEPGKSYLVHADLVAALSGSSKRALQDRVHMGELPAEIDDLFAVRESIRPRPISEEMATVGEYVQWARTRPAAIALRDYLDAHVPDGANDYIFADTMVDDLIVMSTSEYPMANITDHLSRELVLSGVEQLGRIMELFTNLSNALPKWSNNGWSPNELREGMGSGKVFYNEDGSVKRVGPYDACPCGSGKKYKDCHGK
ncbi:MAG: SEC-C domain-containing protein [Eggerthellaceae bacterium]|nr:SEC-C domain-containing protein [Eggerthellaceae bacterium]